jgi:hypothetical protein
MIRKLTKRQIGVIVAGQVVAAGLAYRDLARRPDDLVRGKKRVWRIFIGLNPGNSALYWLIGRRRRPQASLGPAT